jgi:peptide/nickel transport system substrate-binding protein
MSRQATLPRSAASAVALLSLLAAACPSSPPTPTTSAPAAASVPRGPERGNRLVIGLEQEPDKLNSALNAMVYGTYINNAIYGYFVKYDEKMNLIPDVLTEVPTIENGGISADGLRYTYHLRPGLKWHDGHEFTADDVLFSIDAIMDPRHEVESRTGYDHIKTKTAPDPLTVVLDLTEPYAPFIESIFFSEGLMPKHVLAQYVGTGFGQAPFQRAPVGLGPYKFKEWITGQSVTIVANPDYWRGKPPIDEITFRFIPDTNSLLVALKAGEIDGYDNAGTDQRPELNKTPWIQAYVTPQLMWEHVDMNTEDPILKDVRVRQAIQLAINREEIGKQIYEGLWPPAYGDIAETLSWFNPKVREIVRFDPVEAGRLLDEVGWTMGGDGIRAKGKQRLALTISTTAGRVQRERCEEVMQQQLAAVGIELTIQNHNATAFFAPVEQDGVLKKGKYQLAIYAWITSPDPNKRSLYHSKEVPPQGQNNPRLKDPKLDDLIDRGLRTVDPTARKQIYDELQVVLATDVPMTPLVWRSDIDPMTRRLKNFKPNPTQNGDTWNIWEWSLEP